MDLRDTLQSTLGAAYTLERELTGGGMSRVFVAEDATLARKVVVKVLAPELGSGVNFDRFRREIFLAARLQHPHIVPLLTAGEVDGLPYFTMPFVEGESLRSRLVRGELPIAESVAILRDVAKALDYAHAQGRRPPRHQARQRSPHRRLGGGDGLRRGEGGGGIDTGRSDAHRRPASRWERPRTWRPSKRAPIPTSTIAPTSTHLARRRTRC